MRHEIVPGYYVNTYGRGEPCERGETAARTGCVPSKPEEAEVEEREGAQGEQAAIEGAQGAFKTLIDDVYTPTEELIQEPGLVDIEPETIEQLEANFNEAISNVESSVAPQVDEAIAAAQAGDTSQLEGLFDEGNLSAIADNMSGAVTDLDISLPEAAMSALGDGVKAIGSKLLAGANAAAEKFKSLVKDWGSEFWQNVTDPASISAIVRVGLMGAAVGALGATLAGAAGSLAIPALVGLGAASIPTAAIGVASLGRMLSLKFERLIGGEEEGVQFALA